MALPASRFLDPRALAAIRDLRLVARVVVEGFLAGEHPSPRHGPGLEFDQYRAYQPGDDPRRVDWKVYARSERFFVRESEIDQDVTLRLLLDASASMAHRDAGLVKFDYARLAAASLAYLAWVQGDRIALQAVPQRSPEVLPAGRRLAPVLHRLEALEPGGSWPERSPLDAQAVGRRERQLVVVVSDLYQKSAEILRAAEQLRALGHEVLVLHLVARNELAFDFRGDLVFEDLETGETVRGRAESLSAGYMERLRRFLDGCRESFAAAGAGYELLAMDEPLDRALRALLVRRGRLP